MGKASMTLISNLLLLALTLVCVPAAFAGPPARPMVITGEVLAEGKPVPEGTLLKFVIGQLEAETRIMVSEEGMSYARLVIPAYDMERKDTPGGREGDLVKFTGLGSYPLSNMPPVKWKRGQNLKRDFFIKQAINERPAIVSASAIQDGEKWSLKCSIKPIVPHGIDPASVSYRIKWFYTREKATVDEKKETSVFVKEDVLKDPKPGAQSSVEYAGNAADMRFFRVLLTPVLVDRSVGPSVMMDVIPIVTKGDI